MKKSGRSMFGKIRLGCLLVVVLCVVAYGALALIQCAHNKTPSVPAISDALYAITTTSRAYYAKDGAIQAKAGTINFQLIADNYTLKTGDVVILSDWYDLAGTDWVYHEGNSPPMNESAYGNIKIERRQG